MYSASEGGHLQVVELFLSEGAEVDSRDKVSTYICDRACKNLTCKHKLHRVIYSLISSIQNEVSNFLLVAEEGPLNSAGG